MVGSQPILIKDYDLNQISLMINGIKLYEKRKSTIGCLINDIKFILEHLSTALDSWKQVFYEHWLTLETVVAVASEQAEGNKDAELIYSNALEKNSKLIQDVIEQMKRLLQSLDIDSYKYICMVCGFPGLNEPPYSLETDEGSFEYCQCCGFQFGFHDGVEDISHEDWRNKWIERGMNWSNDKQPSPLGWSPKNQIDVLEQFNLFIKDSDNKCNWVSRPTW